MKATIRYNKDKDEYGIILTENEKYIGILHVENIELKTSE